MGRLFYFVCLALHKPFVLRMCVVPFASFSGNKSIGRNTCSDSSDAFVSAGARCCTLRCRASRRI